MKVRFSLYNRPDEIRELLDSLLEQQYENFEVVVVEDGSQNTAKELVESYGETLTVRYFYKENSGQGFTRNYGFARANGDYFIIFDSDCIIPPHYLQTVKDQLEQEWLDAYGGPDASHEAFTPMQRAIGYSMTSLFTTGGIRGQKKHLGPYHPRSFNMGMSRQVYETVGGYPITWMGEDIIYAIMIVEAGFKTGLIEDAYVYHKRRTDFRQFFKQLKFFGRARINVYTYHPRELKLVHFFPAAFLAFCAFTLLVIPLDLQLFLLLFGIHIIYSMAIFIDALLRNTSSVVAVLSMVAAYTQLIAYGYGFIGEYWKRVIKGQRSEVTKYPS
ncbi:MAG: glycosyltransferase [Bacteroidetes bacterium SW_11_45_7]|nr:MAG: glycosyltransferase [Bacteroidetes bacterium SW_11_45_7]